MSKQIGGRWYTRCDGKVRGPFAAGLISRHILVGRLRPQDEVSDDQEIWRPVAEVPDLIPEVMKGDQNDPFVHERLLAAQRWADERIQSDRRLDQDTDGYKEQRRAGDRRHEPEQGLEHRDVIRRRKFGIDTENTFIGWIMLLLVLGGIGWGGYYAYENRPEEVLIDCLAKPAPGVNWQNCLLQGSQLDAADLSGAILRNANLAGAHMQSAILVKTNADFTNMSMATLTNADFRQASLLGADLRGADLRNADLQNANLSFANLTGANLEGANLQGATLNKAIWTNGTTCVEGSVTACSKP